MRTYWIWNPYRQRWHNGVTTISNEVLHMYDFEMIAQIYFSDTGHTIHREQFRLYRLPPVSSIPWKPLNPEQIVNILRPGSAV